MVVVTTVSRQWLRNVARHEVIAGARLREAGVSPGAVRHLLRAERLFRVHKDVYALRPDLGPQGRWLAAVLACGDGAVLSHVGAAALWRLIDAVPLRTHVTVPSAGGRRDPPSIQVHRSRTLTARDRTWRSQIPVTSLARTLDDSAPLLEAEGLKGAVRQAERLHGTDLHRLHAHARSQALRRLLDGYVAGAAIEADELEARFFELCVRAGLPPPDKQAWFGSRRVDFVWRDLRLIVETDGRATHDTTIAFQDDRARDRALKIAGYEVLRFTWAEVVGDPERVARDLRAMLAVLAARSPA